MKTWMSWQAWKPRLNVVSSLSAFSSSSNSNWPPGALTSRIEIFLCGAAHGRNCARPRRRRDAGCQRIRRDVDEGAVAVRHERVRVRAARRLDHVEELRRGRVGDVEDAHALVTRAMARGVDGLGRARAVLAGLAGVDRLEQEALAAHLVDGDVVLRAVAREVGDHARLVGGDVEDAEAAVVARVGVVAPERQVGVDRAVLVGVADEAHVARAGRRGRQGGGAGRAALHELHAALLADLLGPRHVELAGLVRVAACGGR